MVLKFRKFILFFAFFATFIFGTIGCDTTYSDDGLYCIGCDAEEPDSNYITIDITLNDENKEIEVLIFKNKYDLYSAKDTFYKGYVKKSFSIFAKTNQYYSAMATYKSGNRIIHTIDGGWFETKELTGCQNTCWKTLGGSYDLRLKE